MVSLPSIEIQEGHIEDSSFFKGYTQRYKLAQTLEMFGIKLKSENDFKLNFKTDDFQFSIFINLDDKKPLILNCGGNELSVSSFASVILPVLGSDTISVKCSNQNDYNFLILNIKRSHFDAEFLKTLALPEVNHVFSKNLNTIKVLKPNLAIYEVAAKLNRIKKFSGDNRLIASGYCNILIGLKLKEILEKRDSSGKKTNLRDFEIKQLDLICEQIKESPEFQYSIKELCKQTGLSVSKLQHGFKVMHQCTIAIFIRNVRLEKALQLIHDTNLNISEIVYTVGLTSRSYFCRVFKERFKCSPKAYQQQLWSTDVKTSNSVSA